jgi:hypothetical protein
MNSVHVLARVQELLLEGKTDIFRTIRSEMESDKGENTTWGGMQKKDIEAFAENQQRSLENIRFKIERERLRLDILEGKLRADILDALDELDLSNPRDERELWSIQQAVGGSTGEDSLSKALDALAAGGYDADNLAGFIARFKALYPLPEADDDDA